MKRRVINLTMFGDESGAEAAAPAVESAPAQTAGGEAPAEAGVNAVPAGTDTNSARRPNIFPAPRKVDMRRNTVERRQPVPAPQTQTAPAAEPAAAPVNKAEEFKRLITGEYKDEYGQAMQAVVQKRLKDQHESMDELEALRGFAKRVADVYGIQAGDNGKYDVAALQEKLGSDERLYEDEALARGIPVKTLMEMKRLDANRKAEQEAKDKSMDFELTRKHVAGLRDQEKELKQEFPDFDLNREVQNPVFRSLTDKNGVLNLRQAYIAVHGDELIRDAKLAATQKAIEQTKTAMSKAIQSGTTRVQENGLMQTSGGQVKFDPRNISKEMRDDINRRVMGGEHVRLE